MRALVVQLPFSVFSYILNGVGPQYLGALKVELNNPSNVFLGVVLKGVSCGKVSDDATQLSKRAFVQLRRYKYSWHKGNLPKGINHFEPNLEITFPKIPLNISLVHFDV